MPTKTQNKIAKRNEILQAALRAFERKGFRHTRILDISEEANIGKGTLYQYFRNKDEILLAAFADYIQQLEFAVDEVLETSAPPLEKMKLFIMRAAALHENNGMPQRVFFELWLEGAQNHGQSEIDLKPVYHRYRTVLQQLINEAVALGEITESVPEHTASVILATVDGILLQWIVDPTAFDLADAIDSVLDMIFRGIGRVT